MDVEEKEKDLSSSYESYPSPFQEYFPIPNELKCNQVLASYKADVPPVYKLNVKDDFYTRSVVKRSKVVQIKNLTQRPERSLPPNALNAWKDLTPDVKIPDIRHRTLGEIYYTRGKLGEKLNKTKPEFDLSDPINKRKVLDRQKYSALHDSHCKAYFNKPSVLKHLRKQKLVNERGEVLCDVHEFNKYRSYLGELFNDQVKRRINDNNAMEEMERGLTKALCARQRRAQLDAHRAYQQKHREMNLAYIESTKRRYLANIAIWKRKLYQIDRYRAQVKLARTGMYTLKHWNAYLTRQKAANAEERKKQHTLIRIAYAETKNDYVTKYDKFVRLALFERYKADQAAVMIARDDQIDDMEELVQETLKRARSSWLKKYDSFITTCRQNPLSHYQFLLQAQHRKKALMRKYFYKWIQFVLKQRELKPNEEHQSIFQVDRKLKPFVNSLKGFSPSDFNLGEHCGAGDQECKSRRLKKIDKLASLAKMFPKDTRQSTREGTNSNAPATAMEGNGDSIYKERKKKKKKAKKGKEEVDGNEADVEDVDDYIDKMVARYRFQQEELKKKLEGIPPTQLPVIGSGYVVPRNLFSQPVPLDDTQGVQQDTIAFLKDTTDVVQSHEIVKGWKAMKL